MSRDTEERKHGLGGVRSPQAIPAALLRFCRAFMLPYPPARSLSPPGGRAGGRRRAAGKGRIPTAEWPRGLFYS